MKKNFFLFLLFPSILFSAKVGDSGLEDRGEVKVLKIIEPEGLCVMSEGEWECLEMAVDSGATETVISEDIVQTVKTKEGSASKRGVVCETANGETIPNMGEKQFAVGESEEGTRKKIMAQVSDVNKVC